MANILIGIDDSCSGPAMIQFYLKNVHKRTNAVNIIHVLPNYGNLVTNSNEFVEFSDQKLKEEDEEKVLGMQNFLMNRLAANQNLKWNFSVLLSRTSISSAVLSYAHLNQINLIIIGTKSSGQVYGSSHNQYEMGNTSDEILHNNQDYIPVIICPSKGQMYEKIYMKQRKVNHDLQRIQYAQLNDL